MLSSLPAAHDKKHLEVSGTLIVSSNRIIRFVRKRQHSGDSVQCLIIGFSWADARMYAL